MFWYFADLCTLLQALCLVHYKFLFWLKCFLGYLGTHQWSLPVTKGECLKFCSGSFLEIHDCNSLQCAICTLFAFGGLCVLCIWTYKRQAIWEYMQVTWFVKMIHSVTVLWCGTFLFSLLWCCKVVAPPFVQLHTRFYDRPTKIAKFMSATYRGSKIGFLAVLTILCSIEWSRSAVGN